MNKRKPLLLLVLASVAGCERTPCSDSATAEVKLARPVLGTEANITAIADDRQTALDAIDAAYARIDDVNRLMSTHQPDSDVGRLNRADTTEPIVVAPETFHCLSIAAEVSARSGGAFDVTCRPLIELWKRLAAITVCPQTKSCKPPDNASAGSTYNSNRPPVR